MSVIVAKKEGDEITIGADGQVTKHGYSQYTEKDVKLSETNGFTFGTTGKLKDHSFLKLFFDNRTPETNTEIGWIRLFRDFEVWARKKDSDYRIRSCFLIIFGGRIWHFNNHHVREIDDHIAIGSGEHFALAALKLGHTVREAVEVACDLSLYCEEPISIREIDNNKP